MKRLNGLVTTAVVALIAGAGTGASAQARTPAQADVRATVPQIARASGGSLHGVVSDEAGDPVEGATVSAIGETMVFAVTDKKGRFAFDNLPTGQYLLRANRHGFSLPQREYVTVRGSARVVKWLALHRAEPVGTSGTRTPPDVLAAGLGGESAPLTEDTTGESEVTATADPNSTHPHSEAAWASSRSGASATCFWLGDQCIQVL